MSEWQPIETAPKDGKQIIITDGLYSVVGHWHRKKCWVVSWTLDPFDDGIDDAGPVYWAPMPTYGGATE